jgi:Domain of unknown function (DUF1772)
MEEFSGISFVFEFMRFLSIASLGIFFGAMMTEGCVLLPYWRSIAPTEFFGWYAANSQRLQGFFGPLTTGTALLAIVTAIESLWEHHPTQWLSMLIAVISIAIVSTFFLYFKQANASFTTASLSVDEVAVELSRWAMWHWWRTGLSFVAFAMAMLSLWYPIG